MTVAPVPTDSGAVLLSEIAEQPQALRRLLESSVPVVEAAESIVRRRASTIRLVAHGSSDNAASFAVYAFRLAARLDAVRDSISFPIYYSAGDGLRESVVLALSQSGRTPDVVAYVEQANAKGALTVALTNDTDSDLAHAARHVIPLHAGAERSIAATKTYLNQIAAVALLAATVAGDGDRMRRGIESAADSIETILATLRPAVESVAEALSGVDRMFLIARGLEYATAREAALKLTEVAKILASPLTATDFCHGPAGAAGPDLPVWGVASDPPGAADPS